LPVNCRMCNEMLAKTMMALSTESSSLDQVPAQDGRTVDNSPHNSPLEAGEIWDAGLWCNPPHHWGKTPYTKRCPERYGASRLSHRSIGNFFIISHLGKILRSFLMAGTKVASSHCRLKYNVYAGPHCWAAGKEDSFSTDDYIENRPKRSDLLLQVENLLKKRFYQKLA